MRGMPSGMWLSPCRPARTWAPPTSTPPLARVTLAAKKPDPAWTRRVAPGLHGRQRHLSAVWELALEARGVQAALRISFPCPIVVTGGSNLLEGQEVVGLFAYRLVSGHWRVQTGVGRIGEEGTVTTAGVVGLNVVTGWEQRKPEWVDVAWLAIRVHLGRQRMGGVDVFDVEGEEEAPPTPSARKQKAQPPPLLARGHRCPPPEGPAYGHPGGAGGAGGRGPAEGAVGEWVEQQHQLQRVRAWEVRYERGGRQPRVRGPGVYGQQGQAGRRDAVGGPHSGKGPPRRQGENPGARLGEGAQGRGGQATGIDRGGCRGCQGPNSREGGGGGGQSRRRSLPFGRCIGMACLG